MLFREYNKTHEYLTAPPSKYEVKRHGDKFGIVLVMKVSENGDDGIIETAPIKTEKAPNWIVEPYYNSIYKDDSDSDLFILCKHGKFGAVRCIGNRVKWVAPCEYDKVDLAGFVLVLFKSNERLCYFYVTKTVRIFNEIELCDRSYYYLFAIDAKFYYIIDCRNDTVLWLCSRDDSDLSPWSIYGEKPSLAYMGEADGLPMFYDVENQNYIVPSKESKLDFAPHFPNVIMPIIIQGKNIVSITGDARKVNAGNFEECTQQSFQDSEGFDEVTVELKVTLKSKTRTDERCYPIPKGTFTPGDMVYYSEWYT